MKLTNKADLTREQKKMLEIMEEISALGYVETGLSPDIFHSGIPMPLVEQKTMFVNGLYDTPQHRCFLLDHPDEFLQTTEGGQPDEGIQA